MIFLKNSLEKKQETQRERGLITYIAIFIDVSILVAKFFTLK